jgi:hypothetical protein
MNRLFSTPRKAVLNQFIENYPKTRRRRSTPKSKVLKLPNISLLVRTNSQTRQTPETSSPTGDTSLSPKAPNENCDDNELIDINQLILEGFKLTEDDFSKKQSPSTSPIYQSLAETSLSPVKHALPQSRHSLPEQNLITENEVIESDQRTTPVYRSPRQDSRSQLLDINETEQRLSPTFRSPRRTSTKSAPLSDISESEKRLSPTYRSPRQMSRSPLPDIYETEVQRYEPRTSSSPTYRSPRQASRSLCPQPAPRVLHRTSVSTKLSSSPSSSNSNLPTTGNSTPTSNSPKKSNEKVSSGNQSPPRLLSSSGSSQSASPCKEIHITRGTPPHEVQEWFTSFMGGKFRDISQYFKDDDGFDLLEYTEEQLQKILSDTKMSFRLYNALKQYKQT